MAQATIRQVYDNSDDSGHNFGIIFEGGQKKVYVRHEDLSHLKQGDVITYDIIKSAEKYDSGAGVKLANNGGNGESAVRDTSYTQQGYSQTNNVKNDSYEDNFVMGFCRGLAESNQITINDIVNGNLLKDLRNAWRNSK